MDTSVDTSLDTAVDFSVDFGFDAGFNFTPQNIAILVIIVIAIIYLVNNMDKTEGFRGRGRRGRKGRRSVGRRGGSGRGRSSRRRSRKRYRIPGYRRRGKLYGRWWSPRRGYGRRYGRRFGRRWCRGSCEGRSPIYNRDHSLADCLSCRNCGICEYDDGAMECMRGDVYGPNEPGVYPEDCACWYHGKEGGCWPRGVGGYGGYSWNRV